MNWVFAKNFDFLIPGYFQPNVEALRYFKLWIMLDKINQVWNIKGSHQPVAELKGSANLGFWQKLGPFPWKIHFLGQRKKIKFEDTPLEN